MQTAKPQSQPIHQHNLMFAKGAVISADAVLKGNIVVGEGKSSFSLISNRFHLLFWNAG